MEYKQLRLLKLPVNSSNYPCKLISFYASKQALLLITFVGELNYIFLIKSLCYLKGLNITYVLYITRMHADQIMKSNKEKSKGKIILY
jgi:hypothetical protein